jgi:glycosyl transferase family 25
MTINTYIISLASATRRREFQFQQAQRLGFDPVWHSAVGIADISEAFFKDQAFRWRRPLNRAELGCFLSHLSLWRIISVASEPAAILEDDAILGTHWVKDLEALAQLKGVDYVCLETWKNKILSTEKKVGHLTLRHLHLNSAGSAGYIVWPSGAQLLVDQYEKYGPGLADGFINNIDAWQAWQLVPANVIQMNVAPLYGIGSPKESGSLISSSIKLASEPIDIGLHIRMKARRLMGELRKAKINMGVLTGKSRIHVPFQENHFRGD